MKIIKKAFIVLLLALTTSSSIIRAEEARGLWHNLTYACRKLSNAIPLALTSSLQTTKNIKWTKTNIAKAALVATVSTVTLYGISHGISLLKNYLFARKNQNAPVQAATATDNPTVAQPEQQAHEQQSAPAQVPEEPAQTTHNPPTAPEIFQPQQTPATQPLPIQAQVKDEEAQPQPAVAAPVSDEHLAIVPYFTQHQHHVIEPIQFINSDNGATVTIQQLIAFDQYTEDKEGISIGGGLNSCGYHAGPKNVTAITGIIQGLDPHLFVNLLRSSKPAHDLFNHEECHQGHLRHIIIFNRIKTALLQYYLPRIQIVPPQESPEEPPTNIFSPSYHRLRTLFLDNIISETLNKKQDHAINLNSIIQGFMQLPIDISQSTLDQLYCTQEEFLALLHNQERIEKYLHITEPFTISTSDIETALAVYNSAQRTGILDPNGDMLNEAEILSLLQFQQAGHGATAQALNPNHVAVTVIEQATPDLFALTENIISLRELIAHETLPQQRIQAFVLGNTEQSKKNSGHWITVVLECTKKNRRYTIADSANNHIRMFAGSAHNLIRFLEGDKTADLIRPSDAFKRQILDKLHKDIEQCESSRQARQLRGPLEQSITQFQEFVNDYSSFGNQQSFDQRVTPLLYDDDSLSNKKQ